MLQELAELGMALARAAGQQALAGWNEPQAQDSPGAAPGEPAGGGRPHPDPGLVFERVSRAVRQTIALEARIAAGDFGPGAPRRQPNARPVEPGLTDPRLQAIRRALHGAADTETDQAARRALRREIDERLTDISEMEPGTDLSADAIIAGICRDLGIELDVAKLPDEVLDAMVGMSPRSVVTTGDCRSEIPTSPLRPAGPDPP